MKNLDKGTVVRTVLLFIALVNQTLIMFESRFCRSARTRSIRWPTLCIWPVPRHSPSLRLLVAWYKNNYVTGKGKQQKEVLKQKGLTK